MSQISVPVANRHLLIGNHDKCFRGNTKENPADFDEVYLGMFSTVDEKVLIDNPLDGGKLLLCHFPWLESAGRDGYVRERCLQYYPDRSRYMSHGGQIPLLYGHTHVPLFEKKDGIYCVNPGSISIPKNGSAHSYLILEGDTLTWKSLESADGIPAAVREEQM